MLNDPISKVLPTLAIASVEVIQAGCEFARKDDPHAYGSAAKMIAAKTGRLQLRIDIDAESGDIEVQGLVIESNTGTVAAQLFQLKGQPLPVQ